MIVKKLTGTVWVVYEGDKGVIIDAAKKDQCGRLFKEVRALGITVEYILLTHTHYDHTGCVEALRKATGAKVVVGAAEADCLRNGHTPVPSGTNAVARMLGNAGHDIEPKVVEHYEPVTQDIIEIKEETELEFSGGSIKAVPLGAHSLGSVGYIIDGDYFPGDVIFGIGHIVYPLFADFEQDIKAAWEKVISSGAKRIYPGHGRILTMEYFKRKYKKRFLK